MNSETFRKNIKQILIPEADLQAKSKKSVHKSARNTTENLCC